MRPPRIVELAGVEDVVPLAAQQSASRNAHRAASRRESGVVPTLRAAQHGPPLLAEERDPSSRHGHCRAPAGPPRCDSGRDRGALAESHGGAAKPSMHWEGSHSLERHEAAGPERGGFAPTVEAFPGPFWVSLPGAGVNAGSPVQRARAPERRGMHAYAAGSTMVPCDRENMQSTQGRIAVVADGDRHGLG